MQQGSWSAFWLSILVCLGWSPVPVGSVWLVVSVLLSVAEVTLTWRPCQLMAFECPSSTGWLRWWFALLNVSAGESPGGWSHLFVPRAIMHIVVQCLALHEEAPKAACMEHSRPRCPDDFLTWTCAQRIWPMATGASTIHLRFPVPAGRILAGGPLGWLTHTAWSHEHSSSCQRAL